MLSLWQQTQESVVIPVTTDTRICCYPWHNRHKNLLLSLTQQTQESVVIPDTTDTRICCYPWHNRHKNLLLSLTQQTQESVVIPDTTDTRTSEEGVPQKCVWLWEEGSSAFGGKCEPHNYGKVMKQHWMGDQGEEGGCIMLQIKSFIETRGQ